MNIPYSYGKQISEGIKSTRKRDQSTYEANIAKDIAAFIVSDFGFEVSMSQKITRMILNNLTLAKILPSRISIILNILERYGYSHSESLEIIENNCQLLLKDSKDLLHCLAIVNQYGFDKEALLNNTLVSKISARYLYALIEELKANNVEVNEANIVRLYYDTNINDTSKDIIAKFPLTDKKVFTLSFMYDKYLRELNKPRSL